MTGIPSARDDDQPREWNISQPARNSGRRARMPAWLTRNLGKMRVRGRWAPVPDDDPYPLMINGVAVVSAPAEIDIVNSEQLRIALREAGRRGHPAVVLDMTATRFCDSEGFSVLIRAHKRALAEGGGLRLVIPAGSPILRSFRAIGLGRFIPRFASLEQALPQDLASAAVTGGTAAPSRRVRTAEDTARSRRRRRSPSVSSS
jgi:anti-sigma B factor antagonist